jgi:hypothetical protein
MSDRQGEAFVMGDVIGRKRMIVLRSDECGV